MKTPLPTMKPEESCSSTRVATRETKLSSLYNIGMGVFLCLKKEDINMLDMKFLRNNFEEIKTKLQHRGEDLSDLDKFNEIDEKRRKLIAETETLKEKRNEVTKQISVLKKEKKDAEPVIKEMRELGAQIAHLDKELKEIEEQLAHMMLSIPNIPHERDRKSVV